MKEKKVTINQCQDCGCPSGQFLLATHLPMVLMKCIALIVDEILALFGPTTLEVMTSYFF